MRWAVLCLAAAACPKRVTPAADCAALAGPDSFTLPDAGQAADGSLNVTAKLMRMSAEECADSDNAGLGGALWRSKCNRFLEHVISLHCTPAVDAWCARSCSTPEAQHACATAHRGRPLAACARGAIAHFPQVAPFCAGLFPDEVNPTVFLEPDGGGPSCPP